MNDEQGRIQSPSVSDDLFGRLRNAGVDIDTAKSLVEQHRVEIKAAVGALYDSDVREPDLPPPDSFADRLSRTELSEDVRQEFLAEVSSDVAKAVEAEREDIYYELTLENQPTLYELEGYESEEEWYESEVEGYCSEVEEPEVEEAELAETREPTSDELTIASLDSQEEQSSQGPPDLGNPNEEHVAESPTEASELERAKEILGIASQFFAFAETQGGLTLNEDFGEWRASGEMYDVSYMHDSGFVVRAKDENGMFLSSDNDELYPYHFRAVGQQDLERFRKVEKILESQSFDRDQLPVDTVAISDEKLAATYATARSNSGIDFQQ
ncbi:hypothetical protein [cf. Phormidesmis sp. LEGE 11477]|uniref:hypothetical protein n=1 Tax=cf. Phormidesmis sp. LEGE 11477 TaxID=1828680 RepID=UPI00187F6CFF|nr:hypothetical protein [cf. Phormidesmis sp. LEGE 11477]MBE9064117.1 hypothetical protein [cf. Phormidesmis sp. LEGE 11477]